MLKLTVGLLTVPLLFSLATVSSADAKGCIKGAIVGGAAGHLAGHGKVGAVAGCVVGRHKANKDQKAQQQQGQPPAR